MSTNTPLPHAQALITDYLESAKKQFAYYQAIAEKTFEQLTDEQLFWKPNPESNSVANVVQHLWGNMLSRWTDFLTTDGEKPTRNRDAEFDDLIGSRKEMLAKWAEGWACLHQALGTVTVHNFGTKVYIRNQEHTITEAINRQLCHYAYHVGQIVFIGKALAAQQWVSMSIPKGQSAQYNQQKFNAPTSQGHFTDELLGQPPKS